VTKILRIGIVSYEDMKARTMAIARGELKPHGDDPKLWLPSIESLARVLSDKNRARSTSSSSFCLSNSSGPRVWNRAL